MVPPLNVHVGIVWLHLQTHLPKLIFLSVTVVRLWRNCILMTRWGYINLIGVDGNLLLHGITRHRHLGSNLHLCRWKLLLSWLHVAIVWSVFWLPDLLLCHRRYISTTRWMSQPCLACWEHLLLNLRLSRLLSDLMMLEFNPVDDFSPIHLILSHIDVVLNIKAVLLPELLFYSPCRSESFVVPLLDLKVIPDLLLLLRVRSRLMILHTLTGQCTAGAVSAEYDSLLGLQLCALQHAMLLQHWLQA